MILKSIFFYLFLRSSVYEAIQRPDGNQSVYFSTIATNADFAATAIECSGDPAGSYCRMS